MGLEIIEDVKQCQSLSVTADMGGTRYHVVVTRLSDTFVIAVPNFYVAVKSTSIDNAIYRLGSTGLSTTDENNVGEIVKTLLASNQFA